jgi:hypothetical protein
MIRRGNIFIFNKDDEFIREKSTPILTVGPLKDQNGDTINTLSALELTLYNKSNGVIINSRNAQNVLNLNNVTFSAGLITWNMQPLDNKVQVLTQVHDSDLSSEEWNEIHIALFRYEFNGGADQDYAQAQFYITNLNKVT